MKGEFEIIDPESPSTAELIANLLEEKDIGAEAAFALSVGIIADGASFKSARANTFKTLGRLMEKAERRTMSCSNTPSLRRRTIPR